MEDPITIEVKVTDDCNQECLHCVNEDGPTAGTGMDWHLFNQKLKEWAFQKEDSVYRLEEVRLTGGEPLTNFGAVLGIARCCQRLGIRSGINTNGLLFNRERIRLLREAGLETAKVSFDSTAAAAYSRAGRSLSTLDQFLKNLQDLVANRFKVILRFTLSRLNKEQLLPCHRLARELGVHKFQIKPLIRAGRAVELAAYLTRREIDEAILELAASSPGDNLLTEVLCWPHVTGSRFEYKICGSVDKVYISSKLETEICNYVPTGRQAPVGDLSHQSLEDIFHNRHRDFWTEAIDGLIFVIGCPNAVFFSP